MKIAQTNDQLAFLLAVGLHVLLGLFLALDPSGHERPVLVSEAKNTPGEQVAQDTTRPVEVVKATAVDERAVMEEVARLQQVKAQEKQQEEAHQQALKKAAEQAKQARLQEQKQLQALQAEAARLAVERQKTLLAEKQHLKEMAAQKQEALKALNALKAEKVKQEKQQAQQARATQQKQIREAQQQEAARVAQAAEAEANQQRERLNGVVDKYKALILGAISRQWILPEQVKPGLSSQFRIRLAPDGSVLAVDLVRSSGDALLDRSAKVAIYKASPLPVPTDPASFNLFRDIHLTVRPENLRG